VDLMLDRPVAVKLLREAGLRAETLARFRAEARLAGKLSDPHIAQVHDYAEAAPPDPPYLVMELVGSSLAAALAEGPLPVACVLDVLAQASLGLHAAHQAGLVHRDVKPANILLGPGGLVKIADFGIACPSGSVPCRGDGTVTGTPAYLAPELFSGAAAGPASDLYALGIVAYECLAGAPPFTGLAHDVTWRT